jgi:hypothetical protein
LESKLVLFSVKTLLGFIKLYWKLGDIILR